MSSGIIFGVLASVAQSKDGPLIQTADGPVQGGVRIDEDGNDYYAFEGIPFAAPPVGKLRFAPPQPVTPWSEPIDVSSEFFDKKCVQFGYISDGHVPDVTGTEDCLYLTVYVPANRTTDEPMPILFWIYGGSLTAGSNHYKEYGARKWMGQDVIIVEPLYRLGPFGFTYLGIPEAPGNQGFIDVVKALEWVQINIEAFGGDPNRVTIFGESSGSWVVSYLHLTPTANGLFHRAILQSGSLFNPYWTWQTANDSLRLADGLAGAFNCSTMPTADPYAGLDCLQNLPYKDLEQSINWGMEETFQIQKIFRPTGVIDGTFLPDHPVKMMERGEYNHVDLMVGLNKDEGLLQTFSLISHPELYPALMFGWPQTFGPMFLFGRPGNVFSTDNDLGMVEDLTTYYLPNGQWDFNDEHFHNITGSHSFGDALGIADGYKYGVCHADELWYFWLPYWNKYFWSLTEEEKVVSLQLRTAWANFAKYGTPTIPGDETNWEPLTADNHQYMNINNDGWTMELSEDYVNRMANWDAYYTYPEGDTIPDIPEIKITKQQQSPFSYFNQLRP